MTEETTKPMGHFFCGLCEKNVRVADLEKVKALRVGTNLFCPDCNRRITAAVIYRIIEDTSIPKTYRMMFKRYLEWRKER